MGDKYEFWAFRDHPRVLKGERIIFTMDGKPVAEAICHHVEKPGVSKCSQTNKYEDWWKVFWSPSTFKKYKISEKLASSEELEYIGNCTEDDVVESIFGDATNFAQALENANILDDNTYESNEYGVVIKYNPDTDIHSFYKTGNTNEPNQTKIIGQEKTSDAHSDAAKKFPTYKEWLNYHQTGYIPSNAYDKQNFEWVKKDKFPELLKTFKLKDGSEVEFRQSGEPLKYVKEDENHQIMRNADGKAIYMSPEEVRAVGAPEKDTTIAVFLKDNCIALADDEWGTDGIWVLPEYQKQGVGVELLTEFRKQFKPGRRIGQMTPAGENMAIKYYNNLKNAAFLISGEEVLKYMMKLNHWNEDIALQVLGVDSFSSNFELKDFPLSKLRAGDDYNPSLAKQYADLNTPLPPIVLGFEFDWVTRKQKMVVKDGNHRIAAAKIRGDKTIKAYVQVKDQKDSTTYTSNRKHPGTPSGGWNYTASGRREAWRGQADQSESEESKHEWYLEMLNKQLKEAKDKLQYESDPLEQERLVDTINTYEILLENMITQRVLSPFKNALLKTSVDLWHGGKIYGPIEIQAPTKGRYEGGPGLYLTTSYGRAQSYAKGGKSTYLISIKDKLNWANEVEIPLAEGMEFATRHLGKGKLIAKDLKSHCERMGKNTFTANILINLTVNYEAGSGKRGMYLLKFLVDHGVDASLENQSGNEQWVVVFNPKVITKIRKVPAQEVTKEMREMPKISSKNKVVYHATAADKLVSIIKHGLLPSEEANWGGYLGSQSLGRIFFADTPKNAMYYGRILFRDQLEDNRRAFIPICLRISLPIGVEPRTDVERDADTTEPGEESFIEDTTIPPEHIDVWWQGKWSPIKGMMNYDWDEFDVHYNEEGYYEDWEGNTVGTSVPEVLAEISVFVDPPTGKMGAGKASPWLSDANGKPIVMYHGTQEPFTKVDMSQGAQGVFWLTSDLDGLQRGEAGASSVKTILRCYIKINNPAGWPEYEKYGIGELKRMGYDGIILRDPDGTFNAVVFKPSQVKILPDPITKSSSMTLDEAKAHPHYPLIDQLLDQVFPHLKGEQRERKALELMDQHVNNNAALIKNPLLAAYHTAAPRSIWYHGSPFKNLHSILSQGLIPEVKKREWQDDPSANIYNPSRESYGGCYDDKTRILTRTRGFQYFADLLPDDEVATLVGKKLVWEKPIAYTRYWYEGPMVAFKTRVLDQLITPDHKIYWRNRITNDARVRRGDSENEFKLSEVSSLIGESHKVIDSWGRKRVCDQKTWQGIEFKRNMEWHCNIAPTLFEVPPTTTHYMKAYEAYKDWKGLDKDFCALHDITQNSTFRWKTGRSNPWGKYISQPQGFKFEDWLELLGWYLSEGSLDKKGRICISQNKPHYREEICSLLTRMGLIFNTSSRNVRFNHHPLHAYLSQFGLAPDKFVPQEIKELAPDKLEILLNSLMKGDGSWKKGLKNSNNKRGIYLSSSKRLVEDVAEIALKCGYSVSLGVRPPTTGRKIDSKLMGYYVCLSKWNSLTLCGTPTIVPDFKGWVSCVQVSSGVIFVERNGKTCWSGNSYVTTNISTAIGAPRDTGYYGPGRMVLVAMELQPNTMYLDEDDINLTNLNNACPHISNPSYHAPGYYIALTQPNVPDNWKEGLEEIKQLYIDKVMAYWKYKSENDGMPMHPEMEKRFRELLPSTWEAALTRQTAHAVANMKDYDVKKAYKEVFYNAEWDSIPPKEQLFPTIAQGEAVWRKASEQLTRTLKSQARINLNKYKFRDTARIVTPIGYSGSNRIIAVAEIREGHQWRTGKEPVPIIMHYGKLPDDFFAQWKEHKGSEINLMKAGQEAAEKPKNKDEAIVASAHSPIPSVLYHGTVDKFDKFEYGHNNGWSNPREGFYFTDDIEIAKEFGHHVIAAHLVMNNPLDLRDTYKAENDFIKVVGLLPEELQRDIMENKYMNDKVYSAVVRGKTQTPEFIAALKQAGFDSLIIPDQLGGGPHFDSFIVFENDQIHVV